MNSFSNTRTRYRTVITVLLVWLLTLGSSWANACLLQQRGPHLDVGTADSASSARALTVSAGHVGVVATHDEPFDGGMSACLKVCDDAAQSLVTSPSSLDPVFAAMAPMAAFTWAAPPATAMTDSALVALTPPGTNLPLRTRFSRLHL